MMISNTYFKIYYKNGDEVECSTIEWLKTLTWLRSLLKVEICDIWNNCVYRVIKTKRELRKFIKENKK